MANIRKTSSGKWEAAICCNRIRKSKSFSSRREATAWAAQTESKLKNAGGIEKQKRLSDAVTDYMKIETPKKKGARGELNRGNQLLKDLICEKRLINLTEKDFSDYLSRRKEAGLKNSSINRDFSFLKVVMSWSKKRGWIQDDCSKGVKGLKDEPHRERTATEEEIRKICDVAGWNGEDIPGAVDQRIAAAFCLACETGMRAGEIIAIESAWITGRILHLPASATKTNTARDIPLSKRAKRIIELVESCGYSPKIFGMNKYIRDNRWCKIRDKAGLREVRDSQGRVLKEALRFHDGRATFATNAAKKLSVLDLARITGHKDLKMLMRYYRPTAEELADKLDE